MCKTIKLLVVAGARPNFIKVAPLIKATAAHNATVVGGSTRVDLRLVHTGQHYDEKLSDIFFSELGIPAPDVNLAVGSGSHAQQTANIMLKFEPVCLERRPDWLVVVGDVNSTVACTLVCSKLGVRVAHVGAGLRSYDRTMPEEVNRIVTDALSDLLLTPSVDASENLRKEGIPERKIVMVGNVMIDTLVANLPHARRSRLAESVGVTPKDFVYVTLHRAANVDNRENLQSIITEVKRLAQDIPVLLPIHPRTRKMCDEFGISINNVPGLKVLAPIGYLDSLYLTEHARFVLTDSGGLQEESTFFKTPCLTLRPNTERPVTVTTGSNRLTNVTRLADDIHSVMQAHPTHAQIPPLWDGRAAERIIRCLIERSESRDW